MKKIQFLLLPALLMACNLFAQKFTPTVVSSGGGVLTATGINWSFTIGEPAYRTLSASGLSLSQGFQQNNNKGGDILPIEIISFTATLFNGEITVKWQATEVNAKAYQIEGSENGTDFVAIATVAATGAKAYLYTLPETNKYRIFRLKLVDSDGSFAYSKTVKVGDNTLKYALQIFPNPVKTILQIRGNNIIEYSVIDAIGKTKLFKQCNASSSIAVPVSDFQNGVYFIRVKDSFGALKTTIFTKE